MTAVTENKEQEAPVLFNTEPTDCGHLIGIMTLNTPKSLNALSVEMCQLLAEQLEQWQRDDQIVALVLKGAGDKAFCAGGDIRKLYDSMSETAPLPTLMRQSSLVVSTTFIDRCTFTLSHSSSGVMALLWVAVWA